MHRPELSAFLHVLEEDGAWRRITEDGAPLREANSRVHAKVDGRFVSVLRGMDGRALYCIDAVCYHMGGWSAVPGITRYFCVPGGS